MPRRSITLTPAVETAVRKFQASLLTVLDRDISFTEALNIAVATAFASPRGPNTPADVELWQQLLQGSDLEMEGVIGPMRAAVLTSLRGVVDAGSIPHPPTAPQPGPDLAAGPDAVSGLDAASPPNNGIDQLPTIDADFVVESEEKEPAIENPEQASETGRPPGLPPRWEVPEEEPATGQGISYDELSDALKKAAEAFDSPSPPDQGKPAKDDKKGR